MNDPDPRSLRPSAQTDRALTAAESLQTQWRTIEGIGTHDRIAIAQLRVHGPMPMNRLATRIGLSRGAVTSLVDRLERDGWVRRRADVMDRRRTVLELEPQATESYETVTGPWREQLDEWVAAQPRSDRHAIAAFLEQVTTMCERHVAELQASRDQAVV